MAAKLRVDHGDLNMLHDHATNVADGFPGVVRDDHVGCKFFAVVVDLTIQGYFQINLAVAERKAFAHKGAWQTTSTRCRGMLKLNKKK